VNFSGANLAGLWADNASFTDCDFSGAKLDGAILGSDLVRCRFAGRLYNLVFAGQTRLLGPRLHYEQVDLSGAELHHVAFGGVDLDAFTLPRNPELLVVGHWPCVRQWLEARYPGDSGPLAVRLALIRSGKDLPRHGKMVLELATIEEDAGRHGVDELVALLDEASAACPSASG